MPSHTQSKVFRCWYVVQACLQTKAGTLVHLEQMISVLGRDPYWVRPLLEPLHWLNDCSSILLIEKGDGQEEEEGEEKGEGEGDRQEEEKGEEDLNGITAQISLADLLKKAPFKLRSLSNLECEIPPRSSRFDVRRGDEHIAAVCLPRQQWLRGERILVSIDFTGASIVTHRLAIWLEQLEVLASDLSVTGLEEINLAYRPPKAINALVWMHDKWSTDAIQIPLERPASFITTGFTVRWQLRIVFSGREVIDEEEVRFEACIPLSILPRRISTEPISTAPINLS